MQFSSTMRLFALNHSTKVIWYKIKKNTNPYISTAAQMKSIFRRRCSALQRTIFSRAFSPPFDKSLSLFATCRADLIKCAHIFVTVIKQQITKWNVPWEGTVREGGYFTILFRRLKCRLHDCFLAACEISKMSFVNRRVICSRFT